MMEIILNPQPSSSEIKRGVVFISYSHADNKDLKQYNKNAGLGWVTFFSNYLRVVITNENQGIAQLWLDRYEIEKDEAFTPKIESALKETKVILPIFSKNWVISDWCREEVEFFGKINHDASDRIVPVFKDEPPSDKLPSLVQDRLAREGFRFFDDCKQTGKEFSEFYWFGLRDENAYEIVIKQVASSIIEKLGRISKQNEKRSIGRTVFLAYAAPDLEDAREKLKSDLEAMGVTVLPVNVSAPQGDTVFQSVIQSALSQAEFAVHFLGKSHGFIPADGEEAIVDLQLLLMRRVAATQKLTRILWVPRNMPGPTGAGRNPMEVIKDFGRSQPEEESKLQPGEEISGDGVTDLSQWLRKRLEPKPEPEKAAISNQLVVVASAHVDDDLLAVSLARLSQGLGLRIKPLRFNSTWSDIGVDIMGVDSVVLIPWGKANQIEIDALLKKLPETAHIICLILPGGDEAAKNLFFKDEVIVENIAALPTDRPQAKQLLEKLDILQISGVAP